ncbi:MAG: fumarate hydratase [Candidatus Hecatellales archaeon]|nr:MAG: fumarate hydratase [Candidatus Hecatellales archaeon]
MSFREFKLESPVSKEEVLKLKVGDIVYLSGLAYEIKTIPQYTRIIEMYKRGETLPFNLENATIYHTFSSTQKIEEKWRLNYLGFFSSFVLNRYMPEFIKTFKISVIIGKGGMSDEVLKAMKETKCVYLAGVSGCAAYYTQKVKEVKEVFYEEWGPDKINVYELNELGPLIVAMDAHGKNLYKKVERKKKKALKEILTT